MAEILHHLVCKNPTNNSGRSYQPQQVSRISAINSTTQPELREKENDFLSRSRGFWHRRTAGMNSHHRGPPRWLDTAREPDIWSNWSINNIFVVRIRFHLLPWKLTWNQHMEVFKMMFLFKRVIFRFHLSFRVCINLGFVFFCWSVGWLEKSRKHDFSPVFFSWWCTIIENDNKLARQ